MSDEPSEARPGGQAATFFYMYEELPHHSAFTCGQKILVPMNFQYPKRPFQNYGGEELHMTVNHIKCKKPITFKILKIFARNVYFILFAQVRDQVLRSSHFKIYEN